MSFGRYLAEARRKAGLSQKELAARIRKEDGSPISPQYLNDIEHDRRNPPSSYLLQQFARELKISLESLHYWANEFPEDLRHVTDNPEQIKAAFQAFRRVIKKGK